jgi:Flp pilus assembly protein TadG
MLTVKGNNRRGSALLIVGLSMIVIVPAVGLAIDGADVYLVRVRLSQAVDAAALAGGRALVIGANDSAQTANAKTTATEYFNANFPAGFLGTTNVTVSPSVIENNTSHYRSVVVTGSATAPVYFMGILKVTAPVIQISATATRRDVNCMLVLDRSYSMVMANAIPDLQNAAALFVNNYFAPGRDNVGLLTFGGATYLAYPMSTNFLTGSPNVPGLIGQLVGGGGTNTSQALSIAYQQLQALNKPGALNVIVLFTDGRPTAFTADFQSLLTKNTGCDKTTSKLGFLTVYFNTVTWVPVSSNGIFQAYDSSITDASDTTIAPHSTGCAYYNNSADVSQDVSAMPTQDYYGNSTNDGYESVDLTQIGTPTQVQAASVNAADSAGNRIRSDTTLYPVIMAIGLGGTDVYPPDPAFMQRLANTPTSTSFNSTQPAGYYVWAADKSQLVQAFQQVGAQILRLSR